MGGNSEAITISSDDEDDAVIDLTWHAEVAPASRAADAGRQANSNGQHRAGADSSTSHRLKQNAAASLGSEGDAVGSATAESHGGLPRPSMGLDNPQGNLEGLDVVMYQAQISAPAHDQSSGSVAEAGDVGKAPSYDGGHAEQGTMGECGGGTGCSDEVHAGDVRAHIPGLPGEGAANGFEHPAAVEEEHMANAYVLQQGMHRAHAGAGAQQVAGEGQAVQPGAVIVQGEHADQQQVADAAAAALLLPLPPDGDKDVSTPEERERQLWNLRTYLMGVHGLELPSECVVRLEKRQRRSGKSMGQFDWYYVLKAPSPQPPAPPPPPQTEEEGRGDAMPLPSQSAVKTEGGNAVDAITAPAPAPVEPVPVPVPGPGPAPIGPAAVAAPAASQLQLSPRSFRPRRLRSFAEVAAFLINPDAAAIATASPGSPLGKRPRMPKAQWQGAEMADGAASAGQEGGAGPGPGPGSGRRRQSLGSGGRKPRGALVAGSLTLSVDGACLSMAELEAMRDAQRAGYQLLCGDKVADIVTLILMDAGGPGSGPGPATPRQPGADVAQPGLGQPQQPSSLATPAAAAAAAAHHQSQQQQAAPDTAGGAQPSQDAPSRPPAGPPPASIPGLKYEQQPAGHDPAGDAQPSTQAALQVPGCAQLISPPTSAPSSTPAPAPPTAPRSALHGLWCHCLCEGCATLEMQGMPRKFNPVRFEAHGGRAAAKKWRSSVKVIMPQGSMPLERYFQSCGANPPKLARRQQQEQQAVLQQQAGPHGQGGQEPVAQGGQQQAAPGMDAMSIQQAARQDPQGGDLNLDLGCIESEEGGIAAAALGREERAGPSQALQPRQLLPSLLPGLPQRGPAALGAPQPQTQGSSAQSVPQAQAQRNRRKQAVPAKLQMRWADVEAESDEGLGGGEDLMEW